MASGSGTMTPVSGGAGTGLSLAQPLPRTLLSLPRYAKLMGINPLHFARGATPGLDPIVFPDEGCNDLWFKYDWQSDDRVSWYQIATLISEAEQEIANLVKYWSAPVWIEEEAHKYTRPAMREYHGLGSNLRGVHKGIATKYAKMIDAGRRAVSLIGTATTAGGSLVYTDEDGDSFFETVTITLPTTLSDEKEIKVYFSSTNANPDWEIRHPRSISFSGGNVVLIFDSWLFIDPDLYEDYPTDDGMSAIDVSTVANFVASVDVYREYNDNTEVSAEFHWETGCTICGGTGCASCQHVTQDGCAHVRDYDLGIIVPQPASYDEDNAQWAAAAWTEGYEPDLMKLWYYAGAEDQRYIRGYSYDPLSDFWARIITWLVTARFTRPICACAGVNALVSDLRVNLIENTRERTFFVQGDILSSPFGTRKGEVMAWRRIKHLVRDKRPSFAVI